MVPDHFILVKNYFKVLLYYVVDAAVHKCTFAEVTKSSVYSASRHREALVSTACRG